MKNNLSDISDLGFYSQEDVYTATIKAIDRMLNLLPVRDRWCVEFGAWDGIHGSMTRKLITNHDYSAVLIEGDGKRFKELQRNYAGNVNVTMFKRFVGFTAESGLDTILKTTAIPSNFDFCTVDIDGNDYHIWEATTLYRPKIVCIEFNPTIPPEVIFLQAADSSVNQGCSLAALVALGKQKKYELISVIGVNAFFATEELYPLFGIRNNDIYSLWTKRDCVTYFFLGYDGQCFLRGCQKLPWHENLPIDEKSVQIVPKFLRRYPYERRRRTVYMCMTNPSVGLRILLDHLARRFGL